MVSPMMYAECTILPKKREWMIAAAPQSRSRHESPVTPTLREVRLTPLFSGPGVSLGLSPPRLGRRWHIARVQAPPRARGRGFRELGVISARVSIYPRPKICNRKSLINFPRSNFHTGALQTYSGKPLLAAGSRTHGVLRKRATPTLR